MPIRTPQHSPPAIRQGNGATSQARNAEVIQRTRDRRESVRDAPDERTRRKWKKGAIKRRAERIQKSAARQEEKKAAKLEYQRAAVAREYLPEDQVQLWERPANRSVLNRNLTNARQRRLFGLPPLPTTELAGIRRIPHPRSK